LPDRSSRNAADACSATFGEVTFLVLDFLTMVPLPPLSSVRCQIEVLHAPRRPQALTHLSEGSCPQWPARVSTSYSRGVSGWGRPLHKNHPEVIEMHGTCSACRLDDHPLCLATARLLPTASAHSPRDRQQRDPFKGRRGAESSGFVTSVDTRRRSSGRPTSARIRHSAPRRDSAIASSTPSRRAQQSRPTVPSTYGLDSQRVCISTQSHVLFPVNIADNLVVRK
jgi:hypothetical protein